MEFYIDRNHNLLKSQYDKKTLLILGPRGAGKSFYINHLIKDIKFRIEINLLETDTFKKYLDHPSLLRDEVNFQLKRKEKLLVFIDEIQKIPALLDEVHLLIEKNKGKVNFILTGSSARKLKKEQANLLAGRALFTPFVTLRHNEIDFHENFDHIMQYGLLPEVFTDEDIESKIRFLKTYTGTYLREEIMQEAIVKNVEGFSLFLEVAASVNASTVNFSKMARRVGISDQSIKTHYQILEDTLWAHKIPAWTNSWKKQLQKAPKYYYFDNGVLNALRGELKLELNQSSYRYGELFENLIVNEIVKTNLVDEYDYGIYHYRTNLNDEIDLIIQPTIHTPPMAIEIKSAEQPDPKDFKALQKFQKEFPESRALVLCRAKNPYEKYGIEFYPFLEGIREIFKS